MDLIRDPQTPKGLPTTITPHHHDHALSVHQASCQALLLGQHSRVRPVRAVPQLLRDLSHSQPQHRRPAGRLASKQDVGHVRLLRVPAGQPAERGGRGGKVSLRCGKAGRFCENSSLEGMGCTWGCEADDRRSAFVTLVPRGMGGKEVMDRVWEARKRWRPTAAHVTGQTWVCHSLTRPHSNGPPAPPNPASPERGSGASPASLTAPPCPTCCHRSPASASAGTGPPGPRPPRTPCIRPSRRLRPHQGEQGMRGTSVRLWLWHWLWPFEDWSAPPLHAPPMAHAILWEGGRSSKPKRPRARSPLPRWTEARAAHPGANGGAERLQARPLRWRGRGTDTSANNTTDNMANSVANNMARAGTLLRQCLLERSTARQTVIGDSKGHRHAHR